MREHAYLFAPPPRNCRRNWQVQCLLREFIETLGDAMSDGRSIRVYDYVNQPFERVRAALLNDPRGIFGRATKVATERAQVVAGGLRVKLAGIEIGTDIQIDVLGSYDHDLAKGTVSKGTRLDLQWKAIHAPGLFPTMRAALDLYPISATETQLDLAGVYDPPLGALGAVLDALIGHRIAEACVHQFIADVAEHLRAELTKPG